MSDSPKCRSVEVLGCRTSSDEEQRCSNECGPEITQAIASEKDGSPSSPSAASARSLEVDLECGVPEIQVHLAIEERDCRICHLSLDAANQESGVPIDLGCSCKEDLAAAHKHCAEAWFKIKGNK